MQEPLVYKADQVDVDAKPVFDFAQYLAKYDQPKIRQISPLDVVQVRDNDQEPLYIMN